MRRRVITLQLVLLGLALLAVFLLLDRVYIAEREVATLRSADAAMELARLHLTLLGEVRREGDQLYAGETELQEGALVDEVERATGFGCTLFLRDRSIATTERDGSERALGRRASARVRRRVLRDGGRFRGVLEAHDQIRAVLYRPLRDANGHVVGMLAIHQARDLWLSGLATFRGVLFVTLAGLYLLVVLLVRRLRRRVEQIEGGAEEGRRHKEILTNFGVELRTPLVSIMNTGSALRDDALKIHGQDPELVVTGERIESQARQLLGLVNSVLDASKSELEGKPQTEPETATEGEPEAASETASEGEEAPEIGPAPEPEPAPDPAPKSEAEL